MILNTLDLPLIKFQCQNWIESLNSGNVYMNSLSYFRKLEEENSEAGDTYEGKIHVYQGKLVIPKLDQIIELNDDLISTVIEDAFVFCMFSVQEHQMPFSFSEYQKKELLKFGDRALIIKNKDEFIRRLSYKLNTEGYNVSYGYVTYFRPTEDSASVFIDLLKVGIESVALHKREKYSYQQEFRIIAQKAKSSSDHICVNIGDISDIAQQITSQRILTANLVACE